MDRQANRAAGPAGTAIRGRSVQVDDSRWARALMLIRRAAATRERAGIIAFIAAPELSGTAPVVAAGRLVPQQAARRHRAGTTGVMARRRRPRRGGADPRRPHRDPDQDQAKVWRLGRGPQPRAWPGSAAAGAPAPAAAAGPADGVARCHLCWHASVRGRAARGSPPAPRRGGAPRPGESVAVRGWAGAGEAAARGPRGALGCGDRSSSNRWRQVNRSPVCRV